MKINTFIPSWKTAPFIRLLLPFIIGILLQWYCRPPLYIILSCLAFCCITFASFYYLPLKIRFKYQQLQGLFLQLLLICFAVFICRQKDGRQQANWYGNLYTDSSLLVLRINEPPVQKAKTCKAEAFVESIIVNDTSYSTSGKLVIYFAKDTLSSRLAYGDKIIVCKPLQTIKRTGNPGAFDYKRYAAFQQLYHTVYLSPSDYVLMNEHRKGVLDNSLFASRDFIISTIKKYLPNNDKVSGIAEALLIGYKNDLDKDLVQAYSNAGVVHIIAISGLHLGLIYVMLVWLLEKLPYVKKARLLKVVLILGFLWIFSLLTGASASVLRSAVMFTCIIIGKNYFRQASIYNSLAASAFLLLCYDPYFLWDVGFQLSYLAVYGIVWLQKPIYHSWFIKNKWLDKIWQMSAVTLSAQLITFPICIFYFHQFPNYFLLTNLLTVPLSTVILFAEIFLIAFAWLPFLAIILGKLIFWLILLMNYLVEKCNDLPYALTDNIFATAATTFFLYAFILMICGWILYKKRPLLHGSLFSLLILTGLYSMAKMQVQTQQKIIVYNVPKQQAVDFIYKDSYYFKGDSIMQQNEQLKNFHLKPARISLQVTPADSAGLISKEKMYWQFGKASLVILDTVFSLPPVADKIPVDILLISKNAPVKITSVFAVFRPSVVVFDGSNSLWKIAQWKKECEQLLLRCFSVADEGAYVLEIAD